jgi:hypothetical protein
MHVDKHRLGKGAHEKDDLLQGFTYEDLLTAIHCNEPVKDETTVRKIVAELLEEQLTNMYELLEYNIDEIIKRASDY